MLDKDVPIIIVGNKIDLERNRKVTEEQARSYAATVGATYMETSVKLNRNVNETFLTIAQRASLIGATNSKDRIHLLILLATMIEMLQRHKPGGVQRSKSKGVVVVEEDTQPTGGSSKCC